MFWNLIPKFYKNRGFWPKTQTAERILDWVAYMSVLLTMSKNVYAFTSMAPGPKTIQGFVVQPLSGTISSIAGGIWSPPISMQPRATQL
jgi:hypothetical protein